MTGELRDAIYSACVSDATLAAAVTQSSGAMTQGVYFEEAPEEARAPYVVFTFIGSTPMHCFDASETVEGYLVQFTIINTLDAGASGIESIAQMVEDVMDRTALTFATKTHAGTLRETSTGPTKLDDAWMGTIDFFIWYV